MSSIEVNVESTERNSNKSRLFSGNQGYPNDGQTSGQVTFHQVGSNGGSAHSSVIHIMDRSGNQSAMQVANNSNPSMENVGGMAGNANKQPQQNVRKPGQQMPVQLDGLDDDNFEDLSDDDLNLRSVGHASKKSKKSRTVSERLEEVNNIAFWRIVEILNTTIFSV